MPFDPYLSTLLHHLETVPRYGSQNDPGYEAYMVDPSPWVFPAVDVTGAEAPGPHGPVPVRIYTPRAATSASALLWAHGGGFGGGSIDMNEAHMVSAELAHRSGSVVVSVDYRLAIGGVRFPVPLDDVVAAWEWFVAVRPESRLLIGGASAGAALALATAIRVADGRRPDELLLAYPYVHHPIPALDDDVAAEMARLPRRLRFTTGDIDGMVANYTGSISNVPRLALPAHADVSVVNAAHILVSEYDDLRPSAELLERQLRELGIPVDSSLAKGMPHGHLNRTPSLPEVDVSLNYFAAVLKE